MKLMKQIIFILLSIVCFCSCGNNTADKTNFSLKPNDTMESYTDTIYHFTRYTDEIEYVDSVSYHTVIVTTNYSEVNGKIYDRTSRSESYTAGNAIEPITLDNFQDSLAVICGGELPSTMNKSKSPIAHIKLNYYDKIRN